MDALKALVESTKRKLNDTNLIDSKRKFYKRSDFEKIMYQKQNEDNCKSESESVENAKSKDDSIKASAVLNPAVPKHENIPSRAEVIRKLRERKQPIMLFGETEAMAYSRLFSLQLSCPNVKSNGLTNDFKDHLDTVDRAISDNILKHRNTTSELHLPNDGDLTLEDFHEMINGLGRKGQKAADAKVVLLFIQFIQKKWEDSLDLRDEDEKTTTEGRKEAATFIQSCSYIKPLITRLKNNTISEDILEHLVLISKHLLNRNYTKANEQYLEMSIGNSPWPIGVTMVGIHARSGREKISSKNIAHVLNDETQRKFIQVLKRLMSRYQTYYPAPTSKTAER